MAGPLTYTLLFKNARLWHLIWTNRKINPKDCGLAVEAFSQGISKPADLEDPWLPKSGLQRHQKSDGPPFLCEEGKLD